MSYTAHWRKALTVSVCLHLLLFITVGFFNRNLTAPVTEVALEMDLVSDLPSDRAGSSPMSPESAPLPKPQPQALKPAPAEQTPAGQPFFQPVVTTSELAMTEVAAAPVAAGPADGPNNSGSESTAPAPARTQSGRLPDGIAKPGILSKVEPAYPAAARQAGQEGTTVLRIEILANGQPGEISVARSAGYELLDEAAVTAVRKWRFVPAKDRSSGRTVACYTTLPVSFKLQ